MLKQLIQRLLDSRTTPAQAANSCMPGDSSIAVQMLQTATVDWTNVANYTAPTDGFISARGMSSSANAYFQIMAGSTTTNPSTSLQVSTASQWPQMVLPVAKGRKISIYAAMMRDISVFFNSSIGGGYNSGFWRSLLCLRPSFNSSLNVFSRTKSLGLEIKPCRHLQKLRSLLRTALNTRLLRTAGFESEVNQLRRQRCMLQWLPFLQEMVQLYVMYPSERVKLSFATSVHIQDKRTASLFLPLDQVNSFKGGAAC